MTASGAIDTDYILSYVAGTLTVTPAPLTITANDQTKVYGAGVPTLTNQMIAGASDRDIEQAITNLPEYSANPPTPSPGTGVQLPDYYSPSGSANSQATAAKDALFAQLGT
jgi:hypothetical protein